MLEIIRKGLLENGIVLNGDIHLAIVNEPFLTYIKNGSKTIESRFTKNKIAPYNQIKEDDIVCMKAAGKLVDSVFIVGNSNFYENNPNVLNEIKSKFSKQICAFDETFWETRKEKRFISLIGIKRVIILKSPFNVPKKDKRAWVKFDSALPQNIFLIAGQIGSGKTYWADQIAAYFNCARASFSSYIRYKCILKSIECTRQNMQNIGTEVINNELEQYIRYTVSYGVNNQNIVIDGLRHEEVYDKMKELYPNTNIVLLYVDCDEKQRKKNLIIRGDEMGDADKNPMEINATKLRAKAQFILHYSNNPLEEMHKIANLFCVNSLFDLIKVN